MNAITGILRRDRGGADMNSALYNDDHDIWLALDGEILNCRPLRHSLELVGHRFRSGSGAEAVLHAYAQWGLDFLPHLQGAFALALWDQRQSRLVLARDRLGRKPLYMAENDGRLAFGSRIAPLLDALKLPRRLDAEALSCYLTLGLTPPPRTLAEGISKLAPGEMLVAERGEPLRRQGWGSPEPDERRVTHLRRLPTDMHAGNLRTLFECSVADRLGHDAVPCIWLTPNPASAALAAVATRLTGQPAHAVAVVAADQRDGPDARLLRNLAASAQAELTEREVEAEEAGEELTRMAAVLPEPPGDSSALAAWLAAKAMRPNALVMAHTGADEVLLTRAEYACLRRGWLTRLLRRRQQELSPLLAIAPMPPRWMAGDALAQWGLADLRLRVAEAVAPALDAAFAAHGIGTRHPYMDESMTSYALALPSRMRHVVRRRLMAGLVSPSPPQPQAPLPMERWLAGPLAARLKTLLADSPLRNAPLEGVDSWRLLALLEWASALGLSDFGSSAERKESFPAPEIRSPAPPECDPR